MVSHSRIALGALAAVAVSLSLLWPPPAPGKPVPDTVAAQLRGGCAGVCAAPQCTSPCTGSGWVNCDDDLSSDPGSIVSYYCRVIVNEEWVCATCAAVYVSCGEHKP